MNNYDFRRLLMINAKKEYLFLSSCNFWLIIITSFRCPFVLSHLGRFHHSFIANSSEWPIFKALPHLVPVKRCVVFTLFSIDSAGLVVADFRVSFVL